MHDSLAPPEVEPLLTGRFGTPYLYADACGSTQQMLDASLPEGALAVCEEQTSGRGRLGRTWLAPPRTSILSSLLLRPPPERRGPELSLVAGLAAARAVERATGTPAEIKWPNDVMLSGEKVAGVLAEANEGIVRLGIGMNVNQRRDALPPPDPLRPRAGSLFALDGVRRPRAPLLAALVAEVEHAYEAWRARGLEALIPDIAARDFLRGRSVLVDGARSLALGIDPSGALVIDVAGERRLVESGEVLVAATA